MVGFDQSAAGFVYLNNAATSYPKPASVIEAVQQSLSAPVAEPGRTASAGDPLEGARRAIAELFDVDSPDQVVLTASATQALNIAIFGLARSVGSGLLVTSVLEHNSALRPIEHLRRSGRYEVELLQVDDEGRISPRALAATLKRGATLVALTCASNVSGAIQPAEELAAVAAEAGVPLVLDAAQSGGAVPIRYRDLPGQPFLVFAGHKGLLGPAGTGGLIVPDDRLPQLIVGGTGVKSERPTHPEELPLRHEAGTANLPGLAGLGAGVREVLARGVEALGAHRAELVALARERLAKIDAIRLLPLPGEDGRAGIVAFTCEGHDPREVGFTLREVFGVEVRTGLHCAPLAHRPLAGDRGRGGCVRASVGPFNKAEEIELLSTAMEAICRAA